MCTEIGSILHQVTQVLEESEEFVRVRVDGAPGHVTIYLENIINAPPDWITRLRKGNKFLVRIDFTQESACQPLDGKVGGLIEVIPN